MYTKLLITVNPTAKLYPNKRFVNLVGMLLMLCATATFAVTPQALNDTGIEVCADPDAAEFADCAAVAQDSGTYPGQDARFGRDAAALKGNLTKIGKGVSGFDFTKLCNSGEVEGTGNCPANPPLGVNPNDWACTRDNVTGLIWEIKTASTPKDLRDKSWRYSWFSTDSTRNGGNPGTANTGVCFDTTNCDTEKYISAVNAAKLCNVGDWRLPNKEELRSIVDYGTSDPAIDTDFFPDTPNDDFWTASTNAFDPTEAWGISFSLGDADSDSKFPVTSNLGVVFPPNKAVRLVRGGN